VTAGGGQHGVGRRAGELVAQPGQRLQPRGQQRDAISLFEKLLRLRNDVGLLSEERDPAAQRQLGNTPQAFSHFALVISALQLHMGTPARSDHPMQVPGPADNAAPYHDDH
jgi:hypothetical protein